jgi:hypothetical protein
MISKRNSKIIIDPYDKSREARDFQKKLEAKTKRKSKTGLRPIQEVQCLNPQCPHYLKRHRRYHWYSKTKLAKPSCPKCFSHNTEILGYAMLF